VFSTSAKKTLQNFAYRINDLYILLIGKGLYRPSQLSMEWQLLMPLLMNSDSVGICQGPIGDPIALRRPADFTSPGALNRYGFLGIAFQNLCIGQTAAENAQARRSVKPPKKYRRSYIEIARALRTIEVRSWNHPSGRPE
jgi:hypothetical protein